MVLFMLLAAALGAQAAPPGQTGPRERFIVCPGHPRCPRSPAGENAEAGPRPPPGPPAPPAEHVDRAVYFAVNATRLDDRARVILDALASWLVANPSRSATVEGHADARGPRDRNIALAGRRAEAVRDYLVARGVAAGRLTAISYGDARPALYDSGESVWMMNRRVEIRVR